MKSSSWDFAANLKTKGIMNIETKKVAEKSKTPFMIDEPISGAVRCPDWRKESAKIATTS